MNSANGTSTIFDIAPPEIGSDIIEIRGKKLAVRGIGVDDWVRLYHRYPELVRAAATGSASPGDVSPIDAVRMEAAVCAAGFGALDDDAAELAVINNLSREERQLVMMTAINLSRPGDALAPLLGSGAAEASESSG